MTKKTTDLKSLLARFNHPADVSWIRTGVHAIDLMVGGGIPLGRIVEIFGGESAGKSLLGWLILRAFQRAGGVGIVFDVEATAPLKFMGDLGVDTSLVIYEKPETVEEVRDRLQHIVTEIRAVSQAPIVVLWDSIASTSARGEWQKDADSGQMVPKDNEMASRAQAMSDFFRQYTIYLSEQNVTLIAVNQLRDKIGVMFGRKTDSPGGKALKHHASVRLELTRGKKFETSGRINGVECHARVEKNKLAPPFRKATLRINWGLGFDPASGLYDVLLDSGRIKTKKAGGFEYGEKEYKREQLDELVSQTPALLEPWL